MPKIFDCFTFFNELDLLELRLHTLSPVVDYFVLVEATYTFQNNPKPLYFEQNKERYADFFDKIIHVVVEDKPPFQDHYLAQKSLLESYQRNQIMRGLNSAQPDDWILISDLDEILEPDKIAQAIQIIGMHQFGLRHHAYFLNTAIQKASLRKYRFKKFLSKKHYHKFLKEKYWFGPIMGPFRLLSTPQDWRDKREYLDQGFHKHTNAGWHFSYLGGVEAVLTKFNSISLDIDFARFKNTELIKHRLEKGLDVLEPANTLKQCPRHTLPTYVTEREDIFEKYMF